MNNKIAAVVVWYNPTQDLLLNIITYIEGVDKVFVVDNSLQSNIKYIEMINNPKIQYIALGNNMGIAYALNRGARIAYEQGYEWILTMDQDSSFSMSYIEQMLNTLLIVDKPERVGILAAVPSCSTYVYHVPNTKWSFVETAFTSGNLVRLEAWNKVRGFNDLLFIDYVDYDFDFKLQQFGYRLVQCNDVVFEHKLGDVKYYKLCGKLLFASTNHNYIRRYYITRNRLYINKWYASCFPKFVNKERYSNLKEFIKILIVENDKYRKLLSIYHGYKDFKKNKMGMHKW